MKNISILKVSNFTRWKGKVVEVKAYRRESLWADKRNRK